MKADVVGARVLVVNDDHNFRELVALALSDEGYEVASAPHGAAALELVAQVPPAAIVLDVHMPVMDGLEFAKAYRDQPGPHAPILILTASLDAPELAEQVGAAAFLQDPFDLEDILTAIHRLVTTT